MKKIGRFLASMPFAIGLLILLAVACAVCSAIPQGQTEAWYTARYGEQAAKMILALRADDAFHSIWFLILSGALCLSLLCCNLTKLPSLLRRIRAFRESGQAAGSAVYAEGDGDPVQVFRRLRMPEPARKETEEGNVYLFAAKGASGFWGHWVCHLGILLLIVGFALGQFTGEDMTVAALPGQTKPLGNTGLSVRVEDFRAELREDGSAEQYTTRFSLEDAEGKLENAEASVNAPAVLRGYSFYQNSYGWGADIRVEKDGVMLQTDSLCAGELLPTKDRPELVFYLQEVYPELPGYLYRVYYRGEMLGMNVIGSGEALTVDDYAVTFGNPRMYTLLAVKRDSFSWLVFVGGLLILAGLAVAFYVQMISLRAEKQENGSWHLYGCKRRGGALFLEAFSKALEGTGFALTDPAGETGRMTEGES